MKKIDASSFGPFYLEPLQRIVNHAERLSAALSRASAELAHIIPAPSEPSPAEVWLTGRSGELEAFVGDVLDDWRRDVVSADEAAGALNRYLGTVHRGMVQYVTNGRLPNCCIDAREQATVEVSPSALLTAANQDTPA